MSIQQQEKSKIVLNIKTIVQYICHRNKSLREKLLSLERSELKFRKLGGDDWRKSKFYPVICSIRVNIVDIRKLIEEGLSNSKTLLFFGTTIQGRQTLFSRSGNVAMNTQENYFRLNEDYVKSLHRIHVFSNKSQILGLRPARKLW